MKNQFPINLLKVGDRIRLIDTFLTAQPCWQGTVTRIECDDNDKYLDNFTVEWDDGAKDTTYIRSKWYPSYKVEVMSK